MQADEGGDGKNWHGIGQGEKRGRGGGFGGIGISRISAGVVGETLRFETLLY